MSQIITLRLHPRDVGQILDGLRCRLQSWRDTAEYMESGHAPSDDFVAEECHKPEEANGIAVHYRRLINTIEDQLGKQASRKRSAPNNARDGKDIQRSGFCIFINTFPQGPTVAVRDGKHRPWVFKSEREAQLEIIDELKTRLDEFETGERDFEDATSIDEYVLPVTVQDDGSVLDPHGRKHGSEDD